MARATLIATQAAFDAIAVQLNIIYQDDTLTGMAQEYEKKTSPLRDFSEFFAQDPVTGIFSTRTNVVENAYNGEATLATNVKNKQDKNFPPAV